MADTLKKGQPTIGLYPCINCGDNLHALCTRRVECTCDCWTRNQGQPEAAPLAHELIAEIAELTAALDGVTPYDITPHGIVSAVDLLRRCGVALSAAPPAQPHPSQALFDAEAWARDFLKKVAAYPSMLNVGTVAGWFRSAVQDYVLNSEAAQPHPETPQGEEVGLIDEAQQAADFLAIVGNRCLPDAIGVPDTDAKRVRKIAYDLFPRVLSSLRASQPPPEALQDQPDGVDEITLWKREVFKHNELRQEANAQLAAQTEALRALSQKWRAEAEEAKKVLPPRTHVVLHTCADELDALSASPTVDERLRELVDGAFEMGWTAAEGLHAEIHALDYSTARQQTRDALSASPAPHTERTE